MSATKKDKLQADIAAELHRRRVENSKMLDEALKEAFRPFGIDFVDATENGAPVDEATERTR